MTLEEIRGEIAPLMEHYHNAYRRLVSCDLPLVGDISSYLMQKPGKELRPMLMLLTALCCGMESSVADGHPLFRVAASVEMLHNSSLLHDDVIDEATVRRGRDTVNAHWDNKIAVLAGDYFLSRVMMTLNELNRQEVTRVMNDTVATMSIGELVQHQHIGDYNMGEDTYRQIIVSKTASLIGASCELGALLSDSADAMEIEAARRFGRALGTAFQIRDDMLDYLPTDVTGKPQGNDLREHRVTLPLILALSRYNKSALLPLLQKEVLSDSDLSAIIDQVRTCGAYDDASKAMHMELEQAREALALMKENGYRSYLAEIVKRF